MNVQIKKGFKCYYSLLPEKAIKNKQALQDIFLNIHCWRDLGTSITYLKIKPPYSAAPSLSKTRNKHLSPHTKIIQTENKVLPYFYGPFFIAL